MDKERIVHIDGDIIAYSCAAVTQKKWYYAGNSTTGSRFLPSTRKKEVQELIDKQPDKKDWTIVEAVEVEPVNNAIHAAQVLLDKIQHNTKADQRIVFLSGETNYRDRIAKTSPYKGNRNGTKPVHYEAVYNYLLKHEACVVAEDCEADDLLGIFQKENTICATIDKDLDMVEGEHYNWREDKLYNITEDAATYHFYYQLLVGDRVDNIVGIPGIGKVNATRILGKEKQQYGIAKDKDKLIEDSLELYNERLYFTVLCEYEKAYGKEAMSKLIEMGQLLWIRRKVGEMWQPPF